MPDDKSDAPTAIVIGLPWLRSGTGKVMATQLRYLRARGLRTLFVAVPHGPRQGRSDGIWSQFQAHSAELGADKTLTATFAHRISKGGKLGRWYRARCGINAMHWSMRGAAVSPIPPELDLALRTGCVQALLVNHVFAMEFGLRVKERLRALGKPVPLILVTHDIQAHVLIDNDMRNPFTGKLDSLDALLATEIAALARADVLIHVSAEDKRFFEMTIPSKPHILALPTSDDLSGTVHAFPREGRKDLLFVGSNNIGNYQALDWFFSAVRPWFGAQPLSLVILGSIDTLVRSRDQAFYNRIEQYLVGAALDTLPYYLMTDCVIVPMTGGRGVSVKTVEAAAVGRPIVGTRFAYRGLPMDAVEAAGVKICDSPREFAADIRATLQTPEPRREVSRRLYRSLFTYGRFENAMDEAFEAALSP
jgi:hypothetical protein